MLVQHRLALCAILLGLLKASLQVVQLFLLATIHSLLRDATLFFDLLNSFSVMWRNSITVSELCHLPVGTRNQYVMYSSLSVMQFSPSNVIRRTPVGFSLNPVS